MSEQVVCDLLERLRHDLGKAIVLQVTWLGAHPDPVALREALASDLLATRRSPTETRGAVSVFSELRPGLVLLEGDADAARLEAAMEEVAAVARVLEDGTDTETDVLRGVQAARSVAEACRALHRRHARG